MRPTLLRRKERIPNGKPTSVAGNQSYVVAGTRFMITSNTSSRFCNVSPPARQEGGNKPITMLATASAI